ncbi:MAG TPA: SDR family oxidoreductase [Polyangiaceae bacterium]|jgi:NAD(P)-dependent dehydrogenase (short-subunit alcohol dehydrogenase family)|nr:SDR family oxidoreductase [Polyangiaceae bacterium]
MSQIVFVTGANRGIGAATVAAFLEHGDSVVAGARDARAIERLPGISAASRERLLGVEIDVTSDRHVAAAMRATEQRFGRLDLLINMAGILPRPHDQPLEQLDFDQCREAFEVNALGPLRVARAALPLLRRSSNPRIVNITSGCGSLSGKDNGQFYAYGTSKAALNMLSLTMAFEFEKQGICCVALDPGWVKTDLGGANAELTPEFSAENIRRTTTELTLGSSKSFLLYDGKSLTW